MKALGAEKKCSKYFVRLSVLYTMICLYCTNFLYAAASTNYGENAGRWVLTQIFWVAVVVVVAILIVQIIRRSTVGIIGTILVGSLVCYFIKNPTKFETIGNSLGKIIGI